jgi:hypothetical protein
MRAAERPRSSLRAAPAGAKTGVPQHPAPRGGDGRTRAEGEGACRGCAAGRQAQRRRRAAAPRIPFVLDIVGMLVFELRGGQEDRKTDPRSSVP